MHFYPIILNSLVTALESQKPYHFLIEKHLQIIWFEQKNFSDLYTNEKEKIEVISPGMWNTGAGPDFLNAHLRIGHREYKGDVELHLHAEGWYAHTHHLDPRYNQVILHLYFTSTPNHRIIFKENGEKVISLNFSNFLTLSTEQILKTIDLEIYPHQQFTRAGKCAHTLFNTMPLAKMEQFFKSAAVWRLEKKADYLKRRAQNPQNQFLIGLASALGYKHNAEAFSDLFDLLIQLPYFSEKELLAVAMGCCGFFEDQRHFQWKSSAVYQELRLLWWGKQDQITLQVNLRLDGIRPLNHPVRRLVYLVKLLSSIPFEGLWDKLLRLWTSHSSWMKTEKHAHYLQKILLEVLPTFEDAYWNFHFNFEHKAQKKYLALMGNDLKCEILVNAFLPLLYTHLQQVGDSQGLQKFHAFYASFKSANTSKTTYLSRRFFVEANSHLIKSAQVEQGAYQLHKDFCIGFESSCEGCPFVERMQTHAF